MRIYFAHAGTGEFTIKNFNFSDKSTQSFTLQQPLMKAGDIADKLYWNKSNNRYEIDRSGEIEIPTVEGNVMDLPRLYQREDTNLTVESGNIKPSKVKIEYLDID